jgi:predicted NBD/HSP70 family sugar kinase
MARNQLNPLDVKKMNRNRIYRLIYQSGAISKPDLAHQLEISLPTVIQNVLNLLDEGLIEESGMLDSTGGRKAVALSCNKTARVAVGLDITRDHVGAVVIDLYGSILASQRSAIMFENNLDYAKRIAEICRLIINQAGADPTKVLGVGVSIPGVLSADDQTLIYSHVLRVSNVSCKELCKYISYPTVFCNDCNAPGIAEMWNSQSKGNTVYLALSNSVGGAIILGSRLVKGNNQRAGEIGHVTIERHGRRCYCGKRGCLDSYCSATVLSDLANGSLEDFFTLLNEENPKLKAAWDDYLDYLAIAINNLRMTFDCDVIVGGYIGAYITDYLTDLQDRVAVLNTFEEDGSYVKACRFRKEAAAVGAALIFIEKFIETV